MAKFAVIETGGRQHKVTVGEKIRIHKVNVPEGNDVYFDKVLLSVDGDRVSIGAPYLEAKVKGVALKQGREDKKIVFRYHSKTRYRKKKGHRQAFTEIKIVDLGL